MKGYDLRYWREIQCVTRAQLGSLLGRDHQAIGKWERGETPVPTWLPDWLEFMEFELGVGRMPPKAPRKLRDIEAILYPERAKRAQEARASRSMASQANKARLRARADRRTLRQQRRDNHTRLEQERLKRREWSTHKVEDIDGKPIGYRTLPPIDWDQE